MSGRRRTQLAVEADRRNREQLARVGATVREARLRRRLTQAGLGARVGLGRMAISRAERGLGGGLTVDAWQRIALALGMPLTLGLQRDATEAPSDAGHLAIQELVLWLARTTGRGRDLELPTKPAEPWRSIDVSLTDDRYRVLIVIECWNTISDVGASARASSRKAVEADALAILRWGEASRGSRLVWVVRATARNRALVARYPEVFAARFPGSSARWVSALVTGAEAPAEPGLVWASVDGARIWAWRRPGRPARGR